MSLVYRAAPSDDAFRATSVHRFCWCSPPSAFAQTPPAPAPAPAAQLRPLLHQPAPAPAAPAPPAPPIAVNAVLEVNYTANFNKPVSNGSEHSSCTTRRKGQFAINLADVRVSEGRDPGFPHRFSRAPD